MRAVGQSQVEMEGRTPPCTPTRTLNPGSSRRRFWPKRRGSTKAATPVTPAIPPDSDYLWRLLMPVRYWEMDRFGLEPFLSFGGSVSTPVEMARRGYAEKMVLAHDASCFIDYFPVLQEAALPNWNYTHISDEAISVLLNVVSPKTRSRRCWWTPTSVLRELHDDVYESKPWLANYDADTPLNVDIEHAQGLCDVPCFAGEARSHCPYHQVLRQDRQLCLSYVRCRMRSP